MNSTVVKVSPKQMSKLRNGHKVRVKPPEVEGEGCYIVLHPENYDIVSRTFSKNKGAEITLSPEEIQANKRISLSPEQHQAILKKHKVGQGIFGKKFDRLVGKVIGKTAQRKLYKTAEKALPLVKAGLSSAGTALGVAQPELIPIIAGLSPLVSDYLTSPSKYQRKISTPAIQQDLTNNLSAELDRLLAMKNLSGKGLYAGSTGGAIGLNGGFVSHIHPALQSQPFSANFQFQHTLPPAYQKFSKGSGLYA